MSKKWFLYKDQEQKGSFSWEQLKAMASDGSLRGDDLVWTEGMDDWNKAEKVAELFSHQFKPAPPPPPLIAGNLCLQTFMERAHLRSIFRG